MLFIELTNLLDLLKWMPVITMAARSAHRRLQISASVANTKLCVIYFCHDWMVKIKGLFSGWLLAKRFIVAIRLFYLNSLVDIDVQ